MKALSLVLAVVFVIIAILFWTGHFPALPVIATPGVHQKHGIAAIVLALLSLVWYRFQSASDVR